MFCFQSRFTRTLRGGSSSVKSDVPSTKLSSSSTSSSPQKTTLNKTIDSPIEKTITTKDMRRDSEAASEGSGSSSIRYIDQISISESSSTDTLPGIRADYFESEPLSPGIVTLDIPQIKNYNNNKKIINKKVHKKVTGKWRKKLLLKLKNDNEQVCLIKNDGNNKNINNKNKNDDNDDGKKIIKASSANDILTLNGFSECEDDDNDEEEDDDDDDDDDEEENDNDNDIDDVDEEENDHDIDDDDEEYDEGCDVETETEEGSSMPSSPAAALSVVIAPTIQVPYYDFLSVNGGAMRQETTSTSSPQLSSSDTTNCNKINNINNNNNKIETSDDRLSVSGDCCHPSVVGMNLINNKTDKLLDTPTTLPAARSCPNLEQQSICFSSASGSCSPSPSPGPAGPRFRPIEEGDVQVCYLNHTRTLVSKILSSKFLRRWETHRLYLNDACLSSKTMTGFLQQSVAYSSMSEVYTVARWDPTYKYCLRIALPDGSLLLQASNAYTRDQWYHSILWKKNIYKYQNTINSINIKEDIILRELKSMVDFSLWTPLQDGRINSIPLEAVAKLLESPIIINDFDIKDEKKLLEIEEINERNNSKNWAEAVLLVASPLLEKSAPPTTLARALARLAQKHPSSPLVPSLGPAITRCLKHNVDFGKSQDMRKLIQMFIAALFENNDGEQSLRDYISSVHGPGSDCPHPRVLNNLVAICVSAIFHRFEVANRGSLNTDTVTSPPPLQCYLHVLKITSEYADWRPGLGEFLQPIPFPKGALASKEFQETMILPVMKEFANDPRCSVHKSLLPIREPRSGWIHIVAPSSPACPDDGTLFGDMLTTLLNCCCRRKKFMSSLLKNTGSACVLLGIRGCDAAQEALCLMLEWKLLTNDEGRRDQVVSALQSTTSGKDRYTALCQRQRNLQELQQKGGPKKLTLPVRATDADVALLLGGGALGNLECLSLAFTSVTSACAEQLIRLPGLRYLNLWGTKFGDAGLQMISEHLQKLQVLNLCETPVSDKGISTLASLTNLKKLNLNSTKLSVQAFELLKQRLPSLQEYDVRYTEAW